MVIIIKSMMIILLFIVYIFAFALVHELTYGWLPVFATSLLGALFFIWVIGKFMFEHKSNVNYFKIWDNGEANRIIKTEYELQYMQEILSCPTCAYYRCHDESWCSAPDSPDIRNYHCYTFKVNTVINIK